MIRWSLFALGVLVWLSPLHAAEVNKIAVVVNDEVITTYDIDQQVEQLPQAQGLSAVQRQQLQAQVQKKLIEDALVRQRIETLGLTVSEEQLARAIDEIRANNKMSEDQLRAAVLQQGLTWPAYREKVRNEIMTFRLMQKEVYDKIEVTNREVNDYFQQNIEQYRLPPTVDLTRVSLTKSEADIRPILAEVRTGLEAGQEVDQVVAALEGRISANGGVLKAIDPTQLEPTFAQAVAPLKEGEVSGPIETDGTVHVLQVTKRTPGNAKEVDEVAPKIREKLIAEKRQELSRTYVESLREKAYIDIR